jgi:acetyl esterase/lipase
MFVKTVNLWENAPGEYEKAPTLDVFIPEKKTSDIAIVVLPGGAYAMHADYEGAGYAEFLNANGITAFVCPYRVKPHHFPLPLLDARRAVRYVRYHSEEFGIDKNKIYIMGSSAGGHLAALTSTYHAPIDFEGMDEIDKEDCRPNAQILCYPVISLLDEQIAHLGSGRNLLGQRHQELGDALSPNLIADDNTPKAFIWHTFDDGGVNVINSLEYAKRLKQVGVNAEVHIYPHGCHGLGIAYDTPYVHTWTQHLLAWLKL